MRPAVLAALLAPLLVPALAAADEPASTHCYAGNQSFTRGRGAVTYKLVIERSLDPRASEVRERAWSAKDPDQAKVIVAKVDVKTNTFTFDDSATGVKGSGKLEGKPWHWTSQSLTASKGAIGVTVTSKLENDTVHSETRVTVNGTLDVTATADVTRFDCAKLADELAALKKP